jgi:hypothetical protein
MPINIMQRNTDCQSASRCGQDARVRLLLAAGLCLFVGASALAEENTMPPVRPELKLDPVQMRGKYTKRVHGFMTSATTAPIGFPVPIYKSNQTSVNYVVATSGKTAVTAATIMTQDPPATPAAWYRSYLSGNGWTPTNMPVSQQNVGKMYIMGATKGNVNVTVTCVKPKKGNFTIVNIAAMKTRSTAPAKK